MVTVTPEELIPRDHPIRVIKKAADEALKRLEPQLSAIYSERGRPSIPPEALLKAQILIALYSVRSERLFCERLQYDFLFRWFLDLPGAGTAFDATTLAKNREWLLEADLFGEFFREVIEDAGRSRLLSDEHFTVDGTLIEACTSTKSFQPKSGDERPKSGASVPEADFESQERTHETQGSDSSPRFDPSIRRLVSGVLLASAAVLSTVAAQRLRRRLAPGVLLASAAALSTVAAQRLELLHRLPGNAFPYFLAFGLTLLLSLAAGLVAPAAPAGTVEVQAASPLTGRVRSLRYAAAIGTVVFFGWAWIRQGRLAHSLPTLAVWASALVLGTVPFVFAGRRIIRDRQGRVSPGIVAALLLVLIAAACARLIGLEAVPPIFSGDEANQVMDGTSLIREEHTIDPFGTGWIGTGELGMLPAGAGTLLSKDPVAGPRLLYAIAGALSVVACAAAAGLVAGGWGALGCAALLAFSPYHVHFSRLASVFILDALFAAFAVLFLLTAQRSGSAVCGYLAGVSAGLSLYGYAGGRVIAVSFLVALPLLFFVSPASGGMRRWLLLSAVTGFTLTAAPGLRFAFHHSKDWNARLNSVGIFNSAWWGSQVSLRGSPAKVIGDQFVGGTIGLLSQHHNSDVYLAYPIVAPFVLPALALAGLGWMVGRRQFFPVALLALIAAGNLANLMLTVPTPAPQRASSLVPILAILGGVAIAGFLESVPSRGAEGIPWRGTVGALLIGGLLVRTYGGPPRLWEPSPGFGGPRGGFVQSAYETLRSQRYRGESVFLHGRPYLDSYFPTLRYFLPQIHWVDVDTRREEQLPPAPGLHLFSPEWLPVAREWKARFRIPFGIALPDPRDPRHDVGYLFRAGSPPAEPSAPAARSSKRPSRTSRTPS